MDGVCIGCRFLWPNVPGRFCAGCGHELFVRPTRDGAPPEASNGLGSATASSEPQTSLQLNAFHLAANGNRQQNNNGQMDSAARVAESQTTCFSTSRPPLGHGGVYRDNTSSDSQGPLSPMEGVQIAHNPIEAGLQSRNMPGPPAAPSLPASWEQPNLPEAVDVVAQHHSSIPSGEDRTDSVAETREACTAENPHRSAVVPPTLGERTMIKLEETRLIASDSSSFPTRDARSRSPPRARGPDEAGTHGRYRGRDPRRQSPSRPLPPTQPDFYRDSLPWKVFFAKFRGSSPTDALPTLASFWGEFYQRASIDADDLPTTMLQIKDIAHRLITHFNTFNSFVRKRDEFLSEVARYLEARVSEPCYRAWGLRRKDCINTTLQYLLDLLMFSHNLQYFLIRKPLLGVTVKVPANAEFARYLFSIRHQRATVQINHEEYQTCLVQINQYREKYSNKRERATQMLQEDIETYAGTRQTRMIRDCFLCLQNVMPRPGREVFLRSLSPDNFPLPDVATIAKRWREHID
ncbi:hypothetical protein PV04_05839 [Phialophora macrospora]|uniref:Uncharacterized protein n=1 Tax=Phialophora macrospora TaxID=1851006 RepID=A0A0D2CMW9_9EURO|nr:hypothetical protein PV04_05839 [Phialophora macrospora]